MFWKQIDWDQRHIYVCSMIDVVEKKQGKGDANDAQRCFKTH